MTTYEFIEATETIKKGTYFCMTYKTKGKNDTYKIVDVVSRFITYHSTSENPKTPTGEKISKYAKKSILKNGEESCTALFAITKGKNHKPKTRYFMGDGSEISRAEYEAINPPKTSGNPLEWYSKRIEDIIHIGKK